MTINTAKEIKEIDAIIKEEVKDFQQGYERYQHER